MRAARRVERVEVEGWEVWRSDGRNAVREGIQDLSRRETNYTSYSRLRSTADHPSSRRHQQSRPRARRATTRRPNPPQLQLLPSPRLLPSPKYLQGLPTRSLLLLQHRHQSRLQPTTSSPSDLPRLPDASSRLLLLPAPRNSPAHLSQKQHLPQSSQ